MLWGKNFVSWWTYFRFAYFFFRTDCEFDFKICPLEKNIEQMKIYEIFTLRAPVF